MVNYKSLGERIKKRRQQKGLSQAVVAQAASISPSFYGNIERGNRIPSLDTLVAIANILDIGADALLADSLTSARSRLTPSEIHLVQRVLREKIEELDYGSAGGPPENPAD